MLKEDLYLEDLILHLTGTYPIKEDMEPPCLDKSDINLLRSFSSQIVRNLGFTDRQYDLAKRKIDDYADQFLFLSNIDEIKNQTRIPLRQIDRSRWIKIVENSKGDYEIAVRFTFQKKLISSINSIKQSLDNKGSYDSETKVHTFEYSEQNLFKIVNAFKDKNFVLDSTVSSIYDKLDNLNPEDHIPGVYNYEIKNLNSEGTKLIVNEIGDPSANNILLYQDRSLKYGLDVAHKLNLDNLSAKIASRKHSNITINSTKVNVDTLLLALEELRRFPILILLPAEHCHDIIIEYQNYIRNLINNEDVSVIFRLDNQGEGIYFNEYIRLQKINNKVDFNTKVVYSLDNKIPKPLLNSDWKPNTILLHGARPVGGRKVVDCYTDSDLIIHYHDGLAPLHYFYRNNVEEVS